MKKYIFFIWIVVSIVVLTTCAKFISAPSTELNIAAITVAIAYLVLSVETNCFTKNPFKK